MSLRPRKTPEKHEDRLERIKTLTQTARTTWFGYLGALAFAGVILLGVEDKDFFAADSSTQLPLVNVSVPVEAFFAFGAPLIAMIYGYLHVFLEKLWTELGEARSTYDGQPLATLIQPWLVSDFALRWRAAFCPDETPPISTSPLGMLGILASFLLGWLGGPVVMLGFWYISMPAHMAGLTIWIGALFAVSLWTCAASVMTLHRRMCQRADDVPLHGTIHLMFVITLTLFTSYVSTLRTVTDRMPGQDRPEGFDLVHWLRPVPARLAEVNLTQLPADWTDFHTAQRDALADWCKRPDTPACPDAEQVHDVMAANAFKAEWNARRAVYLQVLHKPILRRRDLRSADLSLAFLPGIDLREAQLDHAIMTRAQMEGANLEGANLTGANMAEARMESVRLARARLNGSDMSGARMNRIDLTDAVLIGANLSNAIIEDGARMNGADASSANLAGARMYDTNLTNAKLVNADLSGTRITLGNLNGLDLTGANLQYTLLSGTADVRLSLRNVTISRMQSQGTALRHVDMTGVRMTGPVDLANSFGDGSVQPVSGFRPPCQWVADRVLDDAEYWGRWRGWLDEMPSPQGIFGMFDRFQDIIRWYSAAPPEFRDVKAIPPPAGCTWQSTPFAVTRPAD